VRTSFSKGTSSAASPPRGARTLTHRVATLLLVAAGLGGTMGCDGDEQPPGSTTTSGSGGAGQGGAGGATTGQGGAGGEAGGGSIPCAAPTDCPGEDNECQTRTCEGSVCGVDHAPANKPVAQQAPNDCLRNVCDGQGSVISVEDDLDVPLDDGNSCSSELCAAGMPLNEPSPAGTPCSANGGKFCDGALECIECLVGGDCTSGVCTDSLCVAPTCGDGVANGSESDVDCGGADCVLCADLQHCWLNSDCQSAICQNNKCKVPTCFDFTENGQETDIDCGGASCNKCATGKGCTQNTDCLSNVCSGTVCLPGCNDGAKNGQETDVDCGGPNCPACGTGKLCLASSDCQSQICTNGSCAAASCGDGLVNSAAEACDDGNPSNTDACLTSCALASCGDGYVYAGVEPCDDGNASNTDACLVGCVAPSCGDGYVQFGVEACDDGNVAAGDGCSPTCALEGCGDGVVAGLEQCDDGNVSNEDGCLNNCTPATCGDGFTWAGAEGCDDGNATPNDGCAANCAVEAPYTCSGSPSVCTSAAEINCNDGLDNDADGSADCVDTDCALGCNASIGPCAAGEALLVYSPTDVPKALTYNVPATSNVTVGGLGEVKRAVVQLNITHTFDADLDISLMSPGGPTLDLSSDNGSSGDNYSNTIFHGACSPVTSGTAPFAGCYSPEQSFAGLNGTGAKGSWALNVNDDATGDNGTLTAWRLSLCVAPTSCGDGLLDMGEACDDGDSTLGDGCNGTCEVEAGFTCAGEPSVCAGICGDGMVVAGEGCDDGDLNAGDGCSATCVVEPGYFCGGAPSTCLAGDVEPNSTFAAADARALDPVPTLITGDVLYGGGIQSVGDKDYFRMQLAADSVVRFETFGPSGDNCPSGFATTLKVFNAAQTQLYTDNSSGIASCSLVTAFLSAGTYYVEVEEYLNDATIAQYRMAVDVIPCSGMETEVNDTQALANAFAGSGSACIMGGHQVASDFDYFVVNVPTSGMSLLVETIEGSSAETCESNGIDSTLTLYDSAGTQLVTDDLDGRGYCSKIDGTGASPSDSAAHNLAAGTYYLRVGSDVSTVNGQFDYRLVLSMRAP